ncbi:hypothetical protein ABGB19_09685 [Mycobacterium sp. B14F4]|uniref:hypothetical protein n=1 Tax=Mycobacterium sp. B14F4 TaxID=3153565 RepID=UPI00325EFDC9
MGDHVLTLIAYAGIGVATGWWFWRAHAGVLRPAAHALVAVMFGLLWPVSLPWRALVHVVSRAIAKSRARRVRADRHVIDT